MSNATIYLAKAGQIFGPYNDDEIDVMRTSGSLANFTWIWDGTSVTWNPLDPPPPLPIEMRKPAPQPRAVATPARAVPQVKPQPVVRPQAPVAQVQPPAPVLPQPQLGDWQKIQVLCHDRHHVLAGCLVHVSQAGCEFVTATGSSPAFAHKGQVFLSLLDPESGTVMDVPARLGRVGRKDGAWSYHLFWNQLPEILTQNPAA